MTTLENKCQISQNHILHMKFSELYLCINNFAKFDIYFVELPYKIVLGVITDN